MRRMGAGAAVRPVVHRMIASHELLAALDRIDAFRQDTSGPVFDDSELRAVAGSPEAIQALIAVAADEREPLARRYSATEAIAQSGHVETLASDVEAARAVATMLAEAMTRDEIHNRWGLPGHFVGDTGKLLLALRSGLHGALLPLLGDERPLEIIGSEAATLQHSRRYRIRDLAGYLLAVEQGVPWQDDPDPAVRDRNIERLQR